MYGSRNRGNDFRDFASPDEIIGHSYPNAPVPELDPKDERLLFLSDKNGYLTGRNSVLEIANNELVRRVHELERELETSEKERRAIQERFDERNQEAWDFERENDRLKQYAPKEEEKEVEE